MAPLAASRSDEVAFVITVGASGIAPAQQTSWAMENEFRHQGITAESFIHSISRKGLGFLVSAGFFAESTYDPQPPLVELHQPLLAIWGNMERVSPPLESYLAMKEALDHGGHESYTFLFVPDADHGLRFSPDGFVSSEQFVAGYPEEMIAWLKDVIKGEELATNVVIGDPPQQNYYSSSEAIESSWVDSVWLHLGNLVLFVVLSLSYFVIASLRLFTKNKVNHPHTRLLWYARIAAILLMVTPLFYFGYFGYVMMTYEPGPVLMGRPIPWLILQLLSVATIVFIILLTVSWSYTRSIITGADRVRFSFLVIGGVLFIPWALYWHILSV